MTMVVVALTWASPAGAQRAVDALKAFARVERAQVPQGDTVGILVTLDLSPHFHVWPHEPVLPAAFALLTPIATEIAPSTLPEGARIERIDWPEPAPVTVQYTGAPVQVLSYAGTVVARLLLRLPPAASTRRTTVVLRVRYQACDERVCYPPAEQDVTVRFQIVPAAP
jgi:hypothetical protein